jgi:hypothetical protein
MMMGPRRVVNPRTVDGEMKPLETKPAGDEMVWRRNDLK